MVRLGVREPSVCFSSWVLRRQWASCVLMLFIAQIHYIHPCCIRLVSLTEYCRCSEPFLYPQSAPRIHEERAVDSSLPVTWKKGAFGSEKPAAIASNIDDAAGELPRLRNKRYLPCEMHLEFNHFRATFKFWV